MPGPTYGLDKTFRSYGSIGTYRLVSCDVGTSGYCKLYAGTLIEGSLPGIGFTQTGASKSGEQISVRVGGITKAIWACTQGSSPLGRPVRGRNSVGKIGIAYPKVPQGTPNFIAGFCVGAEGTGSVGAQADILIAPQFT